jgi:hypothetical protein
VSDAYYPADDIELLTATGQYRDRHGAAWRETFAYKRDQERAMSPLVPDTRRARYAVLANHCAQARAGYFYCGQTPADPCGYSAENRHPHSECTAGECKAPHTCGDLAAYGQAAGRWVLCTTHSVKFPAGGEQAHKADTFGEQNTAGPCAFTDCGEAGTS